MIRRKKFKRKLKKKIKKKKTSKDFRKYAKKKLKELYGGRKNRIFAHITCNVCKYDYRIRVNKKETKRIYDSMKRTWICMICKSKRGRK